MTRDLSDRDQRFLAAAELDGADRLLAKYAQVAPDDFVVLAFEAACKNTARILAVALRRQGVRYALLPVVPYKDPSLNRKLAAVVPSASETTGSLVIVVLELHTMSHTSEFRSAMRGFAGAARGVQVVSATPEQLLESYRLEPDDLRGRNEYVLNMLSRAASVSYTTDAGSSIVVNIDHERFVWISNWGRPRAGEFCIMPPGEVATYPAAVSGKFVADGAANCNLACDWDLRLADTPLTLHIEESVVVHAECDNPYVMRLVEASRNQVNGGRIGEFGIGTNLGVVTMVPGNSHVNERSAGVHLAIGQTNQPDGRAEYHADIHLDLIARGGLLTASPTGDRLDLLASFGSSAGCRLNAVDDDVVGVDSFELGDDCCGLQIAIP
jgi:leucyl aminopeptidase (aminopeptidase T)